MDSGLPSSNLKENLCSCGCSFCCCPNNVEWRRTVKRKLEESEEAPLRGGGEDVGDDFFVVARVGAENENVALREKLASQKQQIQNLDLELEEERNASSSAANETMSMIMKLQREKAEVQMESRQFKRYAEEKMEHDQKELGALEELIIKNKQLIQSLRTEIQAYRHKLMSYGFDQFDIDDAKSAAGTSYGGGRYGRSKSVGAVEKWEAHAGWFDEEEEDDHRGRGMEYPSLRCNPNGSSFSESDEPVDMETPRTQEQLQDIEYRIYQLEKIPSTFNFDGDLGSARSIKEKAVVNPSPVKVLHARRGSLDSKGSFSGLPNDESAFDDVSRMRDKRVEPEEYLYPKKSTNELDLGDDSDDRVYTIDSIHGGPGTLRADDESYVHVGDADFRRLRTDDIVYESKTLKPEEYIMTPRDSLSKLDTGSDEVKKLQLRLQALEADRESMRQAIISMQSDKAQLVLLREIAQQIRKELTPERKIVKKPSPLQNFSVMAALKWVVSFVFFRKKTNQRSKYNFGLTKDNVGLLFLLERSSQARHRRLITKAKP